MTITDEVLIHMDAEFGKDYLTNLPLVQAGELRVYFFTKTYPVHGQAEREIRTTYVPALVHGPCAERKRAKYASRVTIIKAGHPVFMKCCRNKQLMTLAEYASRKV